MRNVLIALAVVGGLMIVFCCGGPLLLLIVKPTPTATNSSRGPAFQPQMADAAPYQDRPIAPVPSAETVIAPKQAQPESAPADPVRVPHDAYSIIEEVKVPQAKRQLDVRLNRRLTEAELAVLAGYLKVLDGRPYKRTFMTYYLPHMKPGSGAWATTHFNPDMEVLIHGLTIEGEAKVRAMPPDPTWQVVGSWLRELGFSGKLTIYRKDGGCFATEQYPDGSQRTKELLEPQRSEGKLFQVAGSRYHEYFRIERDSSLQLGDDDGLTIKCEPIAREQIQTVQIASRRNEVQQLPSDEPPPAEPEKPKAIGRTWASADGKFTIEAEFAGMSVGIVRLRKSDGSEIKVPLDKLSQADKDWIEAKRKGREPKP